MKRQRFVVALIVGTVAVGAFLALYLHEEVKAELVSQFRESQLQIARQSAAQIEAYVGARISDVRRVALRTSLQQVDLHAITDGVQARLARLKTDHVDEVTIADAAGSVVYSTNAAAIGSDARSLLAFVWAEGPARNETVKLAMEPPAMAIQRPARTARIANPQLVVATPLYRASAFAGVLFLKVDLQGLAENTVLLTPADRKAPTRSIWAMDADGTVLLQSEHPEMVSRNIRRRSERCHECHVSFDYAERMLTAKQGTADYELKGRPTKVAAFAPVTLATASWIVVVSSPEDAVTGFIQTDFRETLGLLSMVGLVLAVAFVFVNRSARQEAIIAEEARHLREKERLVAELQEDIAQRKVAEQRLQAADEQLREQAALVRLGEMAAVVAHEVKNPLAGIRGTIEVIGGRLTTNTREAAILREVIARIDALDELMKDLLLFARPPQMHAAPVDLVALAKETAALVSQDPAAHDVRFEVEGSAPLVTGDAKLLKIVFLNLMVNATHALRNAGTIRASITATDRTCQIAIADSGPGIPPDIRDRIFVPFFTTKARGTGLGLSTAKRLVDAHHGRITVDCPPTGGTVVAIALPREPGCAA